MANFDRDKALDIVMNGSEEKKRNLIAEIDSLLSHKRYGLIWEHGGSGSNSAFETEDAVKQVSDYIPYPIYEEELSINTDKANGNMLLEGDNYIWLKLLERTYAGKIDVIYIDPPYNTGNKDFIYNDAIVGKNDQFRHSKWLDFMEKRLSIAKTLLSNKGLLFVSIDDNEYAYLRILLDEIFGKDNFLTSFTWRSKIGGANDSKFFINENEYILCYAKNSKIATVNKKGDEIDTKKYNQKDNYINERGPYKLEQLDRGSISYSRSLDYGIEAPDGTMIYPHGYEDYERRKTKVFHKDWCWRWSRKKLQWGIDEDRVVIKKSRGGRWRVYTKQYALEDPEGNKISRAVPYKNYIDITGVNTKAGTKELSNILNGKFFTYPKPSSLIKFLVNLSPNKNGIILDFFAGSGTTAQAVENLNIEDEGNRHWIICTNNEDNICRSVTKPRIDTIITGIRQDGSKYSDGIDIGYQFFTYGFIKRHKDKHINKFNFYGKGSYGIIDSLTMFRYGVHRINIDEQKMICFYENEEMKIISMFGKSSLEEIKNAIKSCELDDKKQLIILVPNACIISKDILQYISLNKNIYIANHSSLIDSDMYFN